MPYARCGKLIVATDEAELRAISALKAKGEANGVDDLQWLSQAEALEAEPALRCVGALLAPSTGILDSHAFMLALQGDAADGGVLFAYRTPFLSAEADDDGFMVEAGGADPMRVSASVIVNAAGLHASAIADRIAGLDRAFVPRTRYARGNYFGLQGPRAVPPSDLSGPARPRPRRAPDLRPRRPIAIRARRRVGRRDSATRSIRGARKGLRKRFAATGRVCRMTR